MKFSHISTFLLLLFIQLNGPVCSQDLNRASETLRIEGDSFYDTTFDYSNFSGRVTDRDSTSSIVKVSSENKNIKFFRSGDSLEFKIQNNKSGEYCQGFVRSIEDGYFVMYVKDLKPCYSNELYFRRGTALILKSDKLAARIREASLYRATLLNKKKDFLTQLNSLNQIVWNFEEKKIEVAAAYDKKIAEIEKQKTRALDQLLAGKNDQLRLQKELGYRLDSLDKELLFYRVEKMEPLYDRWHLDQDLGYPVYNKPEEVRKRKE